MNILITGIHGFVGSNLVKVLMDQNVIYGLDIVSEPQNGVKAYFNWDDVQQGNLPEVDVIIHLAGIAHDTKNKTGSDLYFQVNTGLTQKIFDYYLQSTTKKFIFFSSVKAAADSVLGESLVEEMTPHPMGPYGESKIKAEEYIQSKNLRPEKKVYILRPCMIHGHGNKGNLNLLYNLVKKGIPWPLGSFENKRSFTSMDNLSYIIIQLLNRDISSGIYQIADDEAISTNDLINIMCEAMGQKTHILNIPKWFVLFCAQIGSILHLPLNIERLQKLTENYVVSNNKIKMALDIDHLPLSIRDGLIKTIKSFTVSDK